jgi:hypothetical protein
VTAAQDGISAAERKQARVDARAFAFFLVRGDICLMLDRRVSGAGPAALAKGHVNS